MKDKEKSEQLVIKSDVVNEVVYRITKNGEVATLWRCRSNGVWRELKQMPLEEFESWAVTTGVLSAPDGGYRLLKTLAGKVEEEVNNS
jgi:hypothetical protein